MTEIEENLNKQVKEAARRVDEARADVVEARADVVEAKKKLEVAQAGVLKDLFNMKLQNVRKELNTEEEDELELLKSMEADLEAELKDAKRHQKAMDDAYRATQDVLKYYRDAQAQREQEGFIWTQYPECSFLPRQFGEEHHPLCREHMNKKRKSGTYETNSQYQDRLNTEQHPPSVGRTLSQWARDLPNGANTVVSLFPGIHDDLHSGHAKIKIGKDDPDKPGNVICELVYGNDPVGNRPNLPRFRTNRKFFNGKQASFHRVTAEALASDLARTCNRTRAGSACTGVTPSQHSTSQGHGDSTTKRRKNLRSAQQRKKVKKGAEKRKKGGGKGKKGDGANDAGLTREALFKHQIYGEGDQMFTCDILDRYTSSFETSDFKQVKGAQEVPSAGSSP